MAAVGVAPGDVADGVATVVGIQVAGQQLRLVGQRAALIARHEIFLHVAADGIDGLALQPAGIDVELQVVGQAVDRPPDGQRRHGVEQAVGAVVDHRLAPLDVLRNVAHGQMAARRVEQQRRPAVVHDRTDHVVDGGQRRTLADGVRDAPRPDVGQAGVEALVPQQRDQQQRHALAVAIALADDLGRTVRAVAGQSVLEGHIADVLLHPLQGVGQPLAGRGATGRDGGQQRVDAVDGRVDLGQLMAPAVEGVIVWKNARHEDLRTDLHVWRRQGLGLPCRQGGDDIGEDRVGTDQCCRHAHSLRRQVEAPGAHAAERGRDDEGQGLTADEIAVLQADAGQIARIGHRPVEAGRQPAALRRQRGIEIAHLRPVVKHLLAVGRTVVGLQRTARGLVDRDEVVVEHVGLHVLGEVAPQLVGRLLLVLHRHVAVGRHDVAIGLSGLVDDHTVIGRLRRQSPWHPAQRRQAKEKTDKRVVHGHALRSSAISRRMASTFASMGSVASIQWIWKPRRSMPRNQVIWRLAN